MLQDKVRDVYERAIANVPPVAEKKYWRRYIYLWINYALYEELETKDFPRARDVYSNVLQVLPPVLVLEERIITNGSPSAGSTRVFHIQQALDSCC